MQATDNKQRLRTKTSARRDVSAAMWIVIPLLLPFVATRLTLHRLRPMLASLPHSDEEYRQIL
jgi:hypothetical protein